MKRLLLGLYRVRGVVYVPVVAILVANLFVAGLIQDPVGRRVWTAFVLTSLGVLLLCFALMLVGRRLLPQHEPRRVVSPVRGRWLALNSPASKVPSHGMRMYGQAYAIDLVAEPESQERPAFSGEKAMRAAEEYPALGEPVHAMLDGVVVRASGWRRDHRARSNLLGYLYMQVEGILRTIGGPGFIIGNHVTIRNVDGTFATIAHLQQGSLEVGIGDRVSKGDRLARCGNSGNSSEPHVHVQLMDRASFWTSQGLPLIFADIGLGGSAEQTDGVPENGEHMVAGLPTHTPAGE